MSKKQKPIKVAPANDRRQTISEILEKLRGQMKGKTRPASPVKHV